MPAGTVARVTEISARSDTSFEDAVKTGLARAKRDAASRQVGLDQRAVGGCAERRDCCLPCQHAGHVRPRLTGVLADPIEPG